MKKIVLALQLIVVLGIGFTQEAQAVPVVGPNGHFYEFITGGIDWPTARAAALAQTHLGQQGYLATVTSAAENAFLVGLQEDGWIGGTDQTTEGVWVWADGPEAGLNFWNGGSGGSSPAGTFASWGGGEPNNFIDEDATQLSGGTWNDLPLTAGVGGYFVEFDAPIPTGQVPEPSTYLLFGTALLGLVGNRWRTTRRATT